jgi:hypothetical protein
MVASRPYCRNVANGASDAREQTGWRAVRSPDRRGAKILGISGRTFKLSAGTGLETETLGY